MTLLQVPKPNMLVQSVAQSETHLAVPSRPMNPLANHYANNSKLQASTSVVGPSLYSHIYFTLSIDIYQRQYIPVVCHTVSTTMRILCRPPRRQR
jgi:hypothetical protein